MTRFTISTDIAASADAVFAALTDPSRMRGWLYGTEAITDVSGPLTRAGSTFRQRAAKGVERLGGVVASDPPTTWHARLNGYGERADLHFMLDQQESGTRVTLEADIRNGPAFAGPLVDRLTWRIDRRLWSAALERLATVVDSATVEPVVGGRYAIEGGGRIRIGQVLAVGDEVVHLELQSGWTDRRPAGVEGLVLEARAPKHYTQLVPASPRLRSGSVLWQRGADSLLADGGFGLAHAPMSLTEFQAAAPSLLEVAVLPQDAEARVSAWRARHGATFGSARPPIVGGYFSVVLQAMGVDALGFGVLKLLRQQFRGVHVRVYSNVLLERPASIDETELRSRPIDPDRLSPPPTDEPLAIGHLPLTHRAFAALQPEFISTALVDPDELLGYEEWKLARGGFF